MPKGTIARCWYGWWTSRHPSRDLLSTGKIYPNGFNWEKSNGSRGHGQTTRLTNAEIKRGRVEELPRKKSYDFIIGRAVTALPTFFNWVQDKIAKGAKGILLPMEFFTSKAATIPKN